MTFNDEQELMKALDIESWRGLSKDKVVRFAAMMPDVEPALAARIMEQFPEFRAFALETLDVMEKQHESTLSHNRASQDAMHSAYREVREILKGELTNEDLSWEQRKYILDLIIATGNREFEKDSENKKFLDGLFEKATYVGLGALMLGAAFVGAKAIQERNGK